MKIEAKKAVYERFPFWTAVASGLICTIFTAVGAAAAQVVKADEFKTYIVMSAGLFISVLLAVLLTFKRRAEFGFRKPEHMGAKAALFCLPLLIIEILPAAVCGFRSDMRISEFLILALFTCFVGLNEEIWFRGVAFKAMSAKGSRSAVAVTAVIFGVLHSASLLGSDGAAIGGAGIASTVLQIVFAFGVGIVLAAILVLTKSLLLPVIWHTAHDFIAISTNTRGLFGDNSEVLVTALQAVLLIVSAAGLWIIAVKRENPSAKI